MEPRISIITLGVSDLERSRRFYREGLGLPAAPQSGDTIAFFALSGAWLALFPREELVHDAAVPASGSGFSGVTIAHNVTSKKDVDALLKQADAAGRASPSRRKRRSGVDTGYFADPDGYLWEVAWNPVMPELARL